MFNITTKQVSQPQYETSQNPQAEQLRLNGMTLLQTGQLPAALMCFQQSLQLDPTYARAQLNIGLVYFTQQNFNQAIAEFEKTLQIAPDYGSALNNLAGCYYSQNLFEKAIDTFKKCIELDPQNHNSIYNMGISYAKIKQEDKAIETFKQAIAVNPDQAHDSWAQIGELNMHKPEKIEECLDAFEKMFQLKPDFHLGIMNYGVTLREAGRLDESVAKLTICIQYDQNPLYYLNRALTYLNMLENRKALDDLKVCKSLEHTIDTNPTLNSQNRDAIRKIVRLQLPQLEQVVRREMNTNNWINKNIELEKDMDKKQQMKTILEQHIAAQKQYISNMNYGSQQPQYYQNGQLINAEQAEQVDYLKQMEAQLADCQRQIQDLGIEMYQNDLDKEESQKKDSSSCCVIF